MSLNVSPWRLVFVAAVALLQCVQTVHSQRRSTEEAEGVWEGSVYIVGVAPGVDRDGFRLGDNTRLRLELFPSREQVSVTSPDFPELQMIHLGQLHSSAVIAGVIEGDGHVENWALTVTLQDDRTMLVALSRGVSLAPSSGDASVVTVGALGQLRKNDDD
jgi:hypothetical protein